MSSKDTDPNGSSRITIEAAGVGPTVDLAEVRLPPEVGERFATLYGADGPLRTAAAWIEATREGIETTTGRPPTVDDLCSVADGDHSFRTGEDAPPQDYVCVLDPLAYPFLTDTPGLITSTTQVHGERVTVDVREDGVVASHPDAVISLGVAEDVASVEDVTPDVVYRQVCGYVHVFADEAEYETWAEDVAAATTSVPLETGIGLAAAIADELFE